MNDANVFIRSKYAFKTSYVMESKDYYLLKEVNKMDDFKTESYNRKKKIIKKLNEISMQLGKVSETTAQSEALDKCIDELLDCFIFDGMDSNTAIHMLDELIDEYKKLKEIAS